MFGLRQRHFLSSGAGTGLLFAVMGFCYAISSVSDLSGVPDGNAGGSSDARQVGTSFLTFTNPLATAGTTGVVVSFTDYDLGDAAFGSIITRYVTAEGGVRPYRFTSTGPRALKNIIANTSSNLTLSLAGVLAGSTPGFPPAPNLLTVLGTPGLRFQVTVADAHGTNIHTASGLFNLFLFDSRSTPFRFATDVLPGARLASSYTARLDTLGGASPVSISVLSVTNMTAVPPAAVKLSDLGLFLSSDGSLIGKPLLTGSFAIVARGVDAKGNLARSRRFPQSTDQMYTLNVLDNPVTSGDSMTIKCAVRGDLSKRGKDTIQYSAIVDIVGNDQLNLLNTKFSFQLGGVSVSGILDARGRFQQKFADKSAVSVAVSARSGTFTVQFRGGTFFTQMGLTGIPNGAPVRLPVQIAIGPGVVSCEVLDFKYGLKNPKWSLDYALGRSGVCAAGNFELTSIRGRDALSLTGNPGDSWRIGFLAQPRADVTNPNLLREGFDDISAVNVRIGTNFSQKITGGGIIGAGPTVKFSGGKADGLQSFTFSTKTAKGSIQTHPLGFVDTEIPQAQSSLQYGTIYFMLGVDILRLPKDQPFDGEHSRRIFGAGKAYSDSPPLRSSSPIQGLP